MDYDRNHPDGDEKVDYAKELYKTYFHVPLSHASVYKTFITTLAAINTKIGVSRTGAGAQNILTTHEGYMRFVSVPTLEEKVHGDDFYLNSPNHTLIPGTNNVFNYTNYTTLTPDQFKAFLKKNPAYEQILHNRYINYI